MMSRQWLNFFKYIYFDVYPPLLNIFYWLYLEPVVESEVERLRKELARVMARLEKLEK